MPTVPSSTYLTSTPPRPSALTPKTSRRSVRYAPQPMPPQPVVTPASTQTSAVITKLASEINEALAASSVSEQDK
jgi:hypothetical protein